MPNNQVDLQLEYAKLQLAAEVMFGVRHVDVAGTKVALPIAPASRSASRRPDDSLHHAEQAAIRQPKSACQ